MTAPSPDPDRLPHGDPVGVALAGITGGATSGACLITAGLVALRLVQGTPPAGGTADRDFVLLSSSVMAGLITAVVVTVVRTRPLPDLWRRGVSAGIALFGAALLAGVAAPLDAAGGWLALAAYGVLLATAASSSRKLVRTDLTVDPP